MPCPFCERIRIRDCLIGNDMVMALTDAYPLTKGHTLIVPCRHEPDFFALTAREQAEMWMLAAEVRTILAKAHHPDAFNIGVNAGAAAGQTINHAHIHVIPRYKGDVDDPRGGIRWILPDKAPYWRD
jgi:diadenosine tetraphosphate (Ap4A) HIT family hydrolase